MHISSPTSSGPLRITTASTACVRSDTSCAEQALRLKTLESSYKARQLDGASEPCMTLLDVMNRRAKMKSGKAGGEDLLVPEILQALPFLVVIRVLQLFLDPQDSSDSADSDLWDIIVFVGLPKQRNAFKLKEYSRIGKLSCFLKWYVQSLRPTYQLQAKASRVHSYSSVPAGVHRMPLQS